MEQASSKDQDNKDIIDIHRFLTMKNKMFSVICMCVWVLTLGHPEGKSTVIKEDISASCGSTCWWKTVKRQKLEGPAWATPLAGNVAQWSSVCL